jgi:hypothetical protein
VSVSPLVIAFEAAGVESEAATPEIRSMDEVSGADATITAEAEVAETGRGARADMRADTRREVAAATTHEKASTSIEPETAAGAGRMAEE